MIRTDTVDLTVIPAVAYRQKLTSGGSGVTILRYDTKQPGIASISKTSGEAIPAANVPADLYPAEAFQEAIRLTAGMPYTKRGGVVLKKKKVEACLPDPKDETPEEAAEEVVVDSAEYEKLVRAYTDKSGKFSYDLIGKDFIRFAHASRTVRQMAAEKIAIKKMRNYVVVNKIRKVVGNSRLTEAQALKMGDLLDETNPKSLYKPLDAELRKMSASDRPKK